MQSVGEGTIPGGNRGGSDERHKWPAGQGCGGLGFGQGNLAGCGDAGERDRQGGADRLDRGAGVAGFCFAHGAAGGAECGGVADGGGGGGDPPPPQCAIGPVYSYDSSSIIFISLSKTILE